MIWTPMTAEAHNNIEIARRGYEHAVATGDVLEEIIAADFVWDMSKFAGWLEEPLYHGADGARRFLTEWVSAFEDWRLEIEELHAAGEDKVVGIVRQHARSKTTGAPADMRFAQVFTFRDGLQTRMEMYADPDEALKATGLAP